MITVDKLYQWDLNRTVTVNDAADEMHWQQPYSSMALRTSIVIRTQTVKRLKLYIPAN
jgi:hypothetical protein